MTGFARTSAELDGLAWVWEIKSVNGRGLDIRSRLSGGYDRLEPQVRRMVDSRLTRGNVAVTLQPVRTVADASVTVNETVLGQLAQVAQDLQQRFQLAPASVDGLLALRGVVDLAEPEEDADSQQAREAAVLASLEQALDALVAHREEEGSRLHAIVSGQLGAIAALVSEAEALAAAQPEAIRTRLQQQVDDLLGEQSAIAPERLAQEVAILVTKADIREELDRLAGHVEAGRTLLTDNGAIGRRLDFLTQEFNRETNTLCSKSQDIDLTRIGLELKTVVDQLREQAQNIE